MPKNKPFQFSEKACDNFKRLLTKKGVLLDIVKLRKEWDIKINPKQIISDVPACILSQTTTPIPDHLKNVDNIDEYLKNNPEIINDFINQDTIEETKKTFSIMSKYTSQPDEEFIEDINQLMELYKIPLRYYELLYNFITTGKIHSELFKILDSDSHYFFSYTRPDGEEILAIRIYPETTIKDLEKEWSDIEFERNKYLKIEHKRQKRRKNIDRDLRSFQLQECGKKITKIPIQLKKEFKNSTLIGYPDIPILNKRLKKGQIKNKKSIRQP